MERFKKFWGYLTNLTVSKAKADFKEWYSEKDWTVSHTSSFKENWDFLIMITACWNVFILPINIAFETNDPTTEAINVFVDLCFVMDIIVVFRTTILDEDSGEEIKDTKTIARSYLRGRFTIDFLSTVPFDSIALIFMDEASAKNFKLFGLLKLIRVLRLNRIIMYLNLK